MAADDVRAAPPPQRPAPAPQAAPGRAYPQYPWGYPPQGAYYNPGYPSPAWAPPSPPPSVPKTDQAPPPQRPAPAPQAAPGQGQPYYGQSYPQDARGYAQPGAAQPPRLEVAITNDRPYVQENVLLRLRVISDQNLERADLELPSTNDFLLKRVEKLDAGKMVPWVETRTVNREIINDFILTLTPLRSGDLELPPIQVSGTQAGSRRGDYLGPATPYEVASPRSPLQVRPVLTSVSPWLPLHDLKLTANLDSAREVAEGEPVTISLTLEAEGATGSQLPSLEGLLASPDFRVYREQTLTEGGLSADTRRVVGKRTEYYTLVPHSGGRLRLPALQIAWWNLDKGTREVARLPIHTLQAEGESGPFGLSRFADAGRGEGWGLVWVPLAGLMLLILGYWGGIWYQRRAASGQASLETATDGPISGGGKALRATPARAWAALAGSVVQAGRRLNPLVAGRRAGRRLRRALPAPTRLWLCVGAADREANPAAWRRQFQEQACRNLSFNPKETLPRLSAKLARLRPGADRAQIERLMQQLDGAIYGRQELDFPRWKREFRRQLRPRSGALKGLIASLTPKRVSLPALNPR